MIEGLLVITAVVIFLSGIYLAYEGFLIRRRVIRSFSTDPGTGVSFFKDKIYLCNGEGENILVSIDPLSGDILNRVSTSEIHAAFLTGTNDQFLVFDVRSSGIFEYEPEKLKELLMIYFQSLNNGLQILIGLITMYFINWLIRSIRVQL